jgi:ribonuclease E
MANKMLIDASHPEETRVVVLRGQKIEEFDFESASRKQLRGNIYLAKVTRVEPSLQAAFIEYGGNRHGFLAFSEIHPDYYQIPVADRQALLDADAQAARDEEHEEERRRNRGRRRGVPRRAEAGETISAASETESPEGEQSETSDAFSDKDTEAAPEAAEGTGDFQTIEDAEAQTGPTLDSRAPDGDTDPAPSDAAEVLGHVPYGARVHVRDHHRDDQVEARGGEDDGRPQELGDDDLGDDETGEAGAIEDHEIVEQLGGDALEEVRERPRVHRRQYKIQEVIKRRQILLVQVVKEERGNKGAALTTYLSLAGRYSVLMPNTGRGGGISRKITNATDRKRLKEIAQELEVPEGMGIILRTAGASRTKAEIKRDYEYLMRMWESVRELTLQSAAPALVYEEGSLIKRAIRDLYNKDIEDVLVSGEEGYREAKDFMRMLMPSHAKLVQPYREPAQLFAKHGIEAQLDSMFSNQVTLKSGGYLVINPTEALVSIDVNSGRSTREHNIEDTALKTNLEAAEEVARQLRLRDLAGLIVIDFIDMDEKRNNRAVEKKLNECLKNDRARIQVGRISPFGLLEMSRQRIRTGVLESSSVPCPHCAGTGTVRATPSVALHVLRSVEETLIKSASHNLVVRTKMEAALYILNQKRAHLRELETRFGVTISVVVDQTLTGLTTYTIDRGEPAIRVEAKAPTTGVQIDAIAPMDELDDVDVEIDEDEEDVEEASTESASGAETRSDEVRGEDDPDGSGRRKRRRRRRRGRNGDREAAGTATHTEGAPESDEDEDEEDAEAVENGATEPANGEAIEVSDRGDDDRNGRRRRRGRRGGRGRSREEGFERGERANGEAHEPFAAESDVAAEASLELTAEDPVQQERSQPTPAEHILAPPQAAFEAPAEPPPPAQPEPEPVAVVLTPADPDRPKRAGWWSRAKSVLSGS